MNLASACHNPVEGEPALHVIDPRLDHYRAQFIDLSAKGSA
jgi:hypothetical protein